MRGVLVAVLLMALALAGCTGGSDGTAPTTSATDTLTSSGTSSTSATTTDTGTSAPRDPVTWDVEVLDNSFSPAALTVQVGDTVHWTRVGSNPHTVTADDGSFDSGACPGLDCFTPVGRQEFSYTFGTAGDFGYYCQIHGGPGGSGMSGTVSAQDRYDGTP